MDSCWTAMGSGVAQLYGQADALYNEAFNDGGYFRIAVSNKLRVSNGNLSLDLWFHESNIRNHR